MLSPRSGRTLPAWLLRPFAQRDSGLGQSGPCHAVDPINAMLNLCYMKEAGRLGAILGAFGACAAIGFLHVDKLARHTRLGCGRAVAAIGRGKGVFIREGASFREGRLFQAERRPRSADAACSTSACGSAVSCSKTLINPGRDIEPGQAPRPASANRRRRP